MMVKYSKVKIYVLRLIGSCLILSLLLGWFSYADNDDDLLRDLIRPSYLSQTTLNVGKSAKRVWNEVFEWSLDTRIKFEKQVIIWDDGLPLCHNGPCPEICKVVSEDNEDFCSSKWQHKLVEVEIWKKPPIIVKVTKLLLILVIALSVTMILYNGMMYIIQTWQWKEWKSLMKNIALIVVGILISLFSVVIIRLIQSIPWTIDQELISESGNETDNNALEQTIN